MTRCIRIPNNVPTVRCVKCFSFVAVVGVIVVVAVCSAALFFCCFSCILIVCIRHNHMHIKLLVEVFSNIFINCAVRFINMKWVIKLKSIHLVTIGFRKDIGDIMEITQFGAIGFVRIYLIKHGVTTYHQPRSIFFCSCL